MVQLKAAYEWYIKKKKTTEEQKNGEKDLHLEWVQEDQDEEVRRKKFQGFKLEKASNIISLGYLFPWRRLQMLKRPHGFAFL